jgi:hypothetical protein
MKNTTSKLLTIVASLLLVSSLLVSCKIRGKGDVVTETFQMSAFSAVVNAIEADVYITNAPLQSVEIEAQQNIIDNIILEVTDGQLKIDEKKHLGKHEPIRINISVPELSSINLTGSGNMFTTNTFDSQGNISAVIIGSGNIDAKFNTQSKITTDIIGSGDIMLMGVAPQHEISISGSGNVHTFDLFTNISVVNISGSGTCELTADSLLNVTISGSGDVYFKGYPTITSNISGSGTIHNSN